MKLSIIIPAFNEEDYIGQCLSSVFAEIEFSGARDIEVIVVNNKSTDKTREVARSFPKARVVDEQKKGLVYARQAGVAASSGELLAHIDADVQMPRGWIGKVFNEFKKNPNLVALSGPYTFYDLSKLTNFKTRVWYYGIYLGYLLNRFVVRLGSNIQGGNFIVKRSAWEKMGQYSKEFIFWGEDVDLARRLHKIGDVKFMLSLSMPTSGRRFAQEGLLATGMRYVVNYISVMLFQKPFTKEYKDIRAAKK